MVSVVSLWLPILVAAVLVFIASSIIHMLLPYHRSDYGKVPAEDDVMDALRRFNIPPGDYLLPNPFTPQGTRASDFVAKLEKGPVAMMTVMKAGPPKMGGQLTAWFLYTVVVGVFAGYVAGIVFAPGAPYMPVFRITGTVAFAGYALALWQQTIWYKLAWTSTLKSTFDGLIYALLTAGAFGWLWPS